MKIEFDKVHLKEGNLWSDNKSAALFTLSMWNKCEGKNAHTGTSALFSHLLQCKSMSRRFFR